jgi:hypothetical protein
MPLSAHDAPRETDQPFVFPCREQLTSQSTPLLSRGVVVGVNACVDDLQPVGRDALSDQVLAGMFGDSQD